MPCPYNAQDDPVLGKNAGWASKRVSGGEVREVRGRKRGRKAPAPTQRSRQRVENRRCGADGALVLRRRTHWEGHGASGRRGRRGRDRRREAKLTEREAEGQSPCARLELARRQEKRRGLSPPLWLDRRRPTRRILTKFVPAFGAGGRTEKCPGRGEGGGAWHYRAKCGGHARGAKRLRVLRRKASGGRRSEMSRRGRKQAGHGEKRSFVFDEHYREDSPGMRVSLPSQAAKPIVAMEAKRECAVRTMEANQVAAPRKPRKTHITPTRSAVAAGSSQR